MTNPLTDLRHVDVAILYGQGQKDRAHHVANKLRPLNWDVDVTIDAEAVTEAVQNKRWEEIEGETTDDNPTDDGYGFIRPSAQE